MQQAKNVKFEYLVGLIGIKKFRKTIQSGTLSMSLVKQYPMLLKNYYLDVEKENLGLS